MASLNRRALVSLLLVLPFLAACGSGGGSATTAAKTSRPPVVTPSVTPSPTLSPGIEAFVEDVRRDGLGNRDVQAATDDQLASVGESACQALASNDYGTTVEATTKTGASAAQADELVRSAVRNLCPQYSDMLP